MRLARCVVIAGLVAMPAGWAAWAPAAAQSVDVTAVGVDGVRNEPFNQTLAVIGRFVSLRSGAVASQAAGAVREVLVEIGDHVAKGDRLVMLDNDQRNAEMAVLDSQLRQAEADVAAAEASVTLAEQEFQRQSDLRKSGAFARARFETAEQEKLKSEAALARARAIIAARKAEIAKLALDIANAVVVAPFDGVVTARPAELGSYLQVGDPVVRLLSDSAVEIEADVPAAHISGLRPGLAVEARLEDGTVLTAQVRAVLPSENPMTRTRAVRLAPRWASAGPAVADQQSVSVLLPSGPARQVVTVHKDAIIRNGTGDTVFVVEANTAQSRPVSLGAASGSRVEVLAGLKAGDVVVVRGNERLPHGTPTPVRISDGS